MSERKRFLVGYSISLAIALFFATPSFASAQTLLTPDNVLRIENSLRTSHHLQPWKFSVRLNAVAAARLATLQSTHTLKHLPPPATLRVLYLRFHYQAQTAGENIAWGFLQPSGIVDAWFKSSSHRRNLLYPSFQHVGIAIGRVTVGKKTYTVIVEEFGFLAKNAQ